MKQVAAVLLVAVAITYYMGYEPWELVPALESFVPTSTPPPKVRRAAKPRRRRIKPPPLNRNEIVAAS